MALISRINRLFKADFHAVLDTIEEPEILLKQSIREMRDSLTKTQELIRQHTNQQVQVSRQLESIDEKIKQIQGEIELCLSNENEELARNLVRKKLCLMQQKVCFDTKLEEIKSTIKNLAAQEKEHSTILNELQQKASMVDQIKGSTSQTVHKPDFAISEADIDVAFLKEKQRYSQINEEFRESSNKKTVTDGQSRDEPEAAS